MEDVGVMFIVADQGLCREAQRKEVPGAPRPVIKALTVSNVGTTGAHLRIVG